MPLLILLVLYKRSGIYGIVICSADNTPIKASKIVVQDKKGEIIKETPTTENGRYSLGKLPRGTYTITAYHPSCTTGKAGRVSVKVKPFHRVMKELKLDLKENIDSQPDLDRGSTKF